MTDDLTRARELAAAWTAMVSKDSGALTGSKALVIQSALILRLVERVERAERNITQENGEICQILGQALGYPWYKDDQKNFPGATEANGVCPGDHVAVTLAMEIARKYKALVERVERAERRITVDAERRLVEVCEDAARYRWLRFRMVAADFANEHVEKGSTALIFDLGPGTRVGASLDRTLTDAGAEESIQLLTAAILDPLESILPVVGSEVPS